jgi:hypothetical protein
MKPIKLFLLLASLLAVFINGNSQGILCNPNTFWGKGGNLVNSYTITGSSIVMNSSIPTVPGYGLAVCNNLDGGLYSPTFYTGQNSLVHYDGSNWIVNQNFPICNNLNSGGYGNFLYLLDNGSSKCIQRYINNTYTVIYNDTLLEFTVADIAVDQSGNGWIFQGQASPFTDFILVIDSLGQVIKQYPLSLNTINAYGCFLLNDILYLGFGGANPLFPNSLLPITFSNNSATVGTAIPFTFNNFDLASCDPGNPLSLIELDAEDLELLVFPTITSGNLNVRWNAKADRGSVYDLKIFDVNGKMVDSQSFKIYTDDFHAIIDVKNLSVGIYSLHVYNKQYHAIRKFLKH